MRFKKIVIVSLTLVAFGFLLLTPAMLMGQSLDDLYKAGKKEGIAHFYTSSYAGLNKLIVERFKARYPGVEVKVFRNQTAALCRTIEAQRMAKKVDADVISTTDEGFFQKWKREKFLMKYKPFGWDSVPAALKDPDGYWTAFRAYIITPCYNTEAVSPQDVPKSYDDFLDPKWKGKIVAVHPEFGSSAMTFWHELVDVKGWPYIKKLREQDLLFVRGHGGLTRTILGKERILAIENIIYNVMQAKQKGQPIENIFIEEVGVPLTMAPSGIVAESSHPNAAKLLQNFLLGSEVQAQLPLMRGMYSIRPDIAPPKGLKKITEYKLIPVDVEWLTANREKFIKQFNEAMGRK